MLIRAFITMIFCSRCGRELDEDKLHTTVDVSDTEIICRDCWSWFRTITHVSLLCELELI